VTPATFFLAASLLALPACARRRGGPKPPEIVNQAQTLGAEDRMRAIALLEGYLAGEPDIEVRPWALLNAGEQRRLAQDSDVARAWFEKLAAEHPTSKLKGAALLGMALVDTESGISGNLAASLQLLGQHGVPRTMNADRYRMLARLASDEGSNPTLVRDYVRKAVTYAAGDEEVEARVRHTLEDLLSTEQTGQLADLPQAGGVGAEETARDRVTAALAKGDHSEVIRMGERFTTTWPDSPYLRVVNYAVQRAQAGDKTVAGKVGVLLPLTGEFGPAGARIKQDIKLANDRNGGRLTLVWVDSAGAEEGAITGHIERLVVEEGCVAILGPLLKGHVMEAAETAQAIGVPMVALSQSHDPTEAGDMVFRGFLPLQQQVDALVDWAMKTRGWTRFAVLHPRTSYGDSTRDLFAAAVQRGGGEIKHVVSYEPDATDFLEAAQELGQKDYKGERAGEWYRQRKAAEAAGKDVAKAVLPPIVDYDAIFIPDSWRRGALVASSLAYEEFPVGDFRPHRHAERIPLMGLNGWNNKHIIESGGQYVQDAVFVDAYHNRSDNPDVRAFAADYKQALGRAPGVIDAVTWDATRLLAAAVLAAGPDRAAVRDELSAARLSQPVATGSRFGDDREVARDLLVLTVGKNDIQPWRAPEEALPPEGVPAAPQD
jgi:branched-chain amino acid transport system substrate-binding protein